MISWKNLTCEDCGRCLVGTVDECEAYDAGLKLCQACITSMEEERDVYEQVMRDEGYECVYDPERGFVVRRIGVV